MSTNNEQLLSQKYNNYNYAPGIATYGIDGKTGKTGYDGNNIYFTDYNVINNRRALLEMVSKIAENKLPLNGLDIKVDRPFKEGDLFFDKNGVILEYKLNPKPSEDNYTEYFKIVGKINAINNSSFFIIDSNNDRLILNQYNYKGFDIISGIENADVSNLINKNAAMNIVSNVINENDNIEMIRLQSIDEVDVEDGKLTLSYKITDNAYYIDSNKPIVINSDLKINNDNNINNEYDDFSTVLTSNDTITYFKYLCDKLRYFIMYETDENKYKIIIKTIYNHGGHQILEHIYKGNDTVFGKIYISQNNDNINDIVLVKLNYQYDRVQPYLYCYIPSNISSIAAFSLIHNTEIFLKFENNENNIGLDFDYSMYSSIKLMRYNAFYYGFFNDSQVLIPDEQNYYEYTGDTVIYNDQLCYVWKKHDSGGGPISYTEDRLLTSSLQLTLPFNEDSPEFVASVNIDGEDVGTYSLSLIEDDNKFPSAYVDKHGDIVNLNPDNFILPPEYQGLCILRKTI